MGLFKKLALAMSRTTAETQMMTDKVSIRVKYVLAAGAFTSLCVLLIPVLVQRLASWSEATPNVILAPEAWHAFYSASPAPCAIRAANDPNCVANAHNPILWKSKELRSDAGHADRVKARRNNEFWVGAVVPVQLLEAAKVQRANQLILGWITATYRIWLDGELVATGSRTDSDPVVLSLPFYRLAEKRPLRVAVQIYHTEGTIFPDFFNGGRVGEGFATASRTAAYRNFIAFRSKARPLALFAANLMIACLFFLFWCSTQGKQEYFYVAMYAFVSAAFQARSTDIVFMTLDVPLVYALDVFLRFAEGSFGMFLGFAFARSRRGLFTYGLPLCLGLPFLLLAGNGDSVARFSQMGLVGTWFVPFAHVLGALACFTQAHYLYLISKGTNKVSRRHRAGAYLPVRIQRLAVFGTGLAALAFLFWVQSHGITSPTSHAIWDRFGHFLVVVLLGTIVLTEYKEQALLIAKTPVSEYHRRPVMPARITGAVLVADLKASEAFFKIAGSNDAENLVAVWRSHFYNIIIKNQGTVLFKRGDEVMGFFDNDKCATPLLAALTASDEMSRISRFLEMEFRRRDLFPLDAKGIHFRAAIATGSIRPTWESVGSQREPAWEAAGRTNPLLEANRLLDFEKQIANHDLETLLVMTEDAAKLILHSQPASQPHFAQRARTLRDKHGSIYSVAVYRPMAEDERPHQQPKHRKANAA
ncbi:MAG: hypothetical protein HY074_18940 [Deltaproteobacteria bacterium]|nr:hypothetical protein [Deltaproteobacteria bacterium]